MLSTLQKTLSGALSAFAPTKEPKLLQRPSSDISSQPNDPATPPTTARMPRSRSSPSSHTDTRTQRGGKAKAFLLQNFGAAGDDDPIETSSPPVEPPRVRRVRSGSQPTTEKRQQPGPDFISPKSPASKPELYHQHLIVDADERSLFPGNAPPDSNAFLINPPSSTQSNQNFSSFKMRQGSFLRPMNTLDNAKNSQVSYAPRNRLQDTSSRQSRISGSKNHMPGSKTGYPTRNGIGEPPFKRQRVDRSSKPYVKYEGAGAVSPTFRSITDGDLVMTMSRPIESPGTKQSQSSKSSRTSALAVNEYHSVEKTMQSSPWKKRSQMVISPHSTQRFSNGPGQRSDDSDPEQFTRESKKARYEQRANDPPDSALHSDEYTRGSREEADSRDTPPVISDIFQPSILPSEEEQPSNAEDELSKNASTQRSGREHIHGHTTSDVHKGAGSAAAGPRVHQPRAAVKSIPGKKSTTRPKNASPGAGTFHLRHLKCGILSEEESYTAVISENSLRLYENESLLSNEPIWPDIALSKILKIYYGSDDCLKLILNRSRCQGQPLTKIHLELGSRQEKEEFLSLMPEVGHGPLKVKKEDEFIRKCFERMPDVNPGPQQERLADDNHQPISNQRQVSGTTSRHFQNQQTPPANNITKSTKVTDKLQPYVQPSKIAGADSRIPTVITGKERASQSYSTPPEELSAIFARKPSPEKAQMSNTSRLRSSSSRMPATRSSLRAEMSTHESEEEVPREKYSKVYGLGEPWKTPLLYPKIGKRRMTVEYGDLYRLDEDEFLNDNLIGFFLRYLEYHLEQTNPELAQRVYFYNSYFFERLMQTSKGKKGINYESVQKWTRNIDLFDRDFVVVPVNESYHWYVVIICNLSRLNTMAYTEVEDIAMEALPSAKHVFPSEGEDELRTGPVTEEAPDQPTEKTTESLSQLSLSDPDKQIDELAPASKAVSSLMSPRRGSAPRRTGPGRRKTRHSLPKYNLSAPIIMTFDSLGVARSSTCTALRQYIVEEAKNKKGWDIDGSLIKGMTARGIPTQPNFHDCGLYLCAYLERFILNPAGFVGRILQREMDPKTDMPMIASEELRSRMRGLIRGLHNEQEGEEVEFPIPEIGRILLAPPPKAASPDDTHAPRTPLQDDSEDELQQDHTNPRVPNTVRVRHRDPTPPTSRLTKNLAPGLARPLEEHSPSKTSTMAMDILAKINKSAPSPANSKSGTRETAITIDDDDDDDDSRSVSDNVSATKKPVAEDDFSKRSSGKKFTVHDDDYFEHPSELKDIAGVGKTHTPRRKTKEAPTSTELAQRRRSQSIASADTVNTEFLSGSGNKSYQHDGGQDAGRLTTPNKAEHSRQTPEIVVVIPDSQERKEVEGEERREVELGEDREGTEHEPQMILEGIE